MKQMKHIECILSSALLSLVLINEEGVYVVKCVEAGTKGEYAFSMVKGEITFYYRKL